MREVIASLPGSKIREVANAGIGRDDVLAFWFGESDETTPEFIRDAATRSLRDGETFYAHNLGLPELRAAIAGYVGSLRQPLGPERIAVTSSGVNALMLAMQTLVGAGDEVVAVVPVWPNLTAQPEILGARRHPRAAATRATAPGGSTWTNCSRR
jgi:aspartate/methionine/tyrosine aminotransferase